MQQFLFIIAIAILWALLMKLLGGDFISHFIYFLIGACIEQIISRFIHKRKEKN